MSLRSQVAASWHALGLPALLETLKASQTGLSHTEVAVRLREFGPNRLPEQPPPAWWQIALHQFRSPLIYVLAAAAILSVVIGDLTDAVFISAALVLNAVIGTYQEWKAERSTHALRKLLQVRASVQRDGEVFEISADEVVPGDLIWLESGNRVPADARLLTAHGLEADESLLTGESRPLAKAIALATTALTLSAILLTMTRLGSGNRRHRWGTA